ncbi:hypothetical protein A3860_22395 [Niastella vici]|uniref:PE-PGRS family protein n=1 Tax=Niastella vici TaxID=1703345 RepID=A0A1V9G0W9_9BACT|nr:hypothetical protein [Niastella vici]OQP64158.1 hypothetical protein A3860_22395 [Niastella vici]
MKARLQYLLFAFLFAWPVIAMQSCLPFLNAGASCNSTGQNAHYSAATPAEFSEFNPRPQAIPLQRKRLHEISGIAASLQYKNRLYVQEDNGHPNYLYVTNSRGDDVGRLLISKSLNRDWEDIAVGPGPLPQQQYIYIADIGDNHAWRCRIQIYRLPEPELEGRVVPVHKIVKGVDVITLKYPDRSHNAETILLDPFTRDLYIATKEDDSCRIFVARYPQSTRNTITLEPVIKLPFHLVTSGNIASNGQEILLRNEQLYWYWKRSPGETVAAALSRPPQEIVPGINEPQGEAICFTADRQGYFTCSEVHGKQEPVIYFYKRGIITMQAKNP